MAAQIWFKDLIEALAGAVIEAQDRIEQHQIINLTRHFDDDLRPESLLIRLPSMKPDAGENAEDYYRVPLLTLVPRNALRIKDIEMTFRVNLGELAEEAAKEPPEGAKAALAPPEKKKAVGEAPSPRKDIRVDVSGGLLRRRAGAVRVVLRVEGTEPTEGIARLLNHLVQTQGVIKTVEVE